MTTVAELGTSFNLPNYRGRVIQLTPSDTPLTSILMGTAPGGGQVSTSRTFEWQTYSLRNAGQNVKPDGDRTGTPQHRARANVFNVLETHREDVDLAYEKLAQIGQFDGQNISGPNPVVNEEAWQIDQMWKQIKRDIEFSAINGSYTLPANNGQNAATRGLREAITTNVIDNAAVERPVSLNILNDAMQSAWDNGGLQESEMGTVVVNSVQKRWITDALKSQQGGGTEPRERMVAGVSVETIQTDFGVLNVMLNRYMPQDEIMIVSLDQCQPWFRFIPGKGVMFAEPTAKVGASNATQLYCSFGLEYGNEAAHALITDLPDTAPVDA